MFAKRLVSLSLIGGALGLVALVAGACGAAEEPTPTSTAAPRAVATPTPIATPTPTVKEPKYGGIAIFANRGDPPAWDPMVSAAGTITNTNVSTPIYGHGNLLKPCREDIFQVCPNLAESWESNPDFTVWTFKIREGVLWHDGRPLTAADLKWWLDLAFNGAPGRPAATFKPTMGPISKVEVVDGNKLRVTLSRPMPLFYDAVAKRQQNVAHPPYLMQPEIDKGKGTVAPNDVGWVSTGPFKMLKYEKGSMVQVRRFDRYWEKDAKGRQLPFMDGIDFPIITDPSAILAAFRTGRVDATARGSGFFVTPEQKAIVQREMGDKVQLYRIAAYDKLSGINSRKPPWNDVRVRQAVSLWVDRDSGIQAVHSGEGEVWALFPSISPYGNPDFKEWPGYNPKTKEADRKRAKELLAEAGYPEGFKTTILTRDVWLAFGEWLQGQMEGLLGKGKVSIQMVDTATYNKRLCAGDYEILPPNGSERDLPEDFVATYSTTNPCAQAHHDDKKVDEYFDKITATKDPAERTRLSRELERYIVLEKALSINVWVEFGTLGFRSYVKGWPVPAWGTSHNTDHATTWLDK